MVIMFVLFSVSALLLYIALLLLLLLLFSSIFLFSCLSLDENKDVQI